LLQSPRRSEFSEPDEVVASKSSFCSRQAPNIETLDKSTIATILTDEALRTKISGKISEADKRKLIKEVLVDELSRVKAELKAVTDNRRSLESTVANKEGVVCAKGPATVAY
jgi:hypothetical protein